MPEKIRSGTIAIYMPGTSFQQVYDNLQALGYTMYPKAKRIEIRWKGQPRNTKIRFPEKWTRPCFERQDYPRFHITVSVECPPIECDLTDPLTIKLALHCDIRTHETDTSDYGHGACHGEIQRIKRRFGGGSVRTLSTEEVKIAKAAHA